MAANRTDEIVELLRTKITSRQLLAGDALAREELLAQDYGVSRACVRESLGILKAQGYLTSRRGKYGGTFVSTLIDSDEVDTLYRDLVLMDQMKIREILEARLLIEPEAAKKAASHPQSVNFGKSSCALFSEAEPNRVLEKSSLETYINFHNGLGKSALNPFYYVSIRSFMKFISTFMETIGQNDDTLTDCLYDRDTQTAVTNAIQAQDSSLAFEKMYLYTALSKEKILKLEPTFDRARKAVLNGNALSS